MGILSTEPHKGDRIIVSQDKDMQTVPGLLVRPHVNMRVQTVTPEAAERYMLLQAITGDQTDGYPGLPGAGPAAAEMLLAGQGYAAYQHVFRSGPRKGLEETRWRITPMDRWSAIVSAYEKAGLGEADAVTQVNLARILKHGEWDGKRVIPWSPPRVN